MSAPELIKVKVRDLKPYHYGIWCSITGGQPFTNDIVIVKWQGDGKRVTLMLESHNFVTGLDPDEEIEVVKFTSVGEYYAEKYGNWSLPPPPPLPVTIESLTTERDEWKARVAELEALILNGFRVASALTQDTQTPEEMALDLVRQVREARLQRDEWKARATKRGGK